MGYSPQSRKESDTTEWLNNNKQVDSVRLELHCWIRWASQVVLVVKNPPANAGDINDACLISGSGRSPGGPTGNPLQHSCLENPMDGGAWWATIHMVSESDMTEVT